MTTYYFPCGETIETKIDVGHACGILIAQKGKDENKFRWNNNTCKECKRDCKLTSFGHHWNREEHKEEICEDVRCIAYSKEYLDNKSTIDYLCPDEVGKYTIEIILQLEEYRLIIYKSGLSQNVGLLSLVDEYQIEEIFNKFYNEEYYSIWMTNMETGDTTPIEFERIDEIIQCIVSVRFIKLSTH